MQQEIFKLKGKAEVLKVDVAKETEKKQDSRRKLHETDEKLIAERHLQSVLRQEWGKEKEEAREERVEDKQVINQLETKVNCVCKFLMRYLMRSNHSEPALSIKLFYLYIARYRC